MFVYDFAICLATSFDANCHQFDDIVRQIISNIFCIDIMVVKCQ